MQHHRGRGCLDQGFSRVVPRSATWHHVGTRWKCKSLLPSTPHKLWNGPSYLCFRKPSGDSEPSEVWEPPDIKRYLDKKVFFHFPMQKERLLCVYLWSHWEKPTNSVIGLWWIPWHLGKKKRCLHPMGAEKMGVWNARDYPSVRPQQQPGCPVCGLP